MGSFRVGDAGLIGQNFLYVYCVTLNVGIPKFVRKEKIYQYQQLNNTKKSVFKVLILFKKIKIKPIHILRLKITDL